MLLPLGMIVTNGILASPEITIEIEKQNIEMSQYPNNVVINEILFDDALSGDKGEYVELFNPTANAIDM